MARSARKIGSLLDDEPELVDPLTVVVERTDGGDREIEWADVSDDLSSGQWGRLIEQGILVDGDAGFELADPDAVAEALAEQGVDVDTDDSETDVSSAIDDEIEETIEDDDASWTTWDKAAAVAAVGLMFGYWLNDFRNLIGSTVDVVFGPIDQVLPFYAVIIVLSVITGVNTSVLQSLLIDSEKMAAYQERMQQVQDEMEERRERAKERGDDEELQEIQKEQMQQMGENLGMFKLQFRPMVWTMLITIPVFLWMYWKIGIRGGAAHGEFGSVVFPFVGTVQTWTQGVLGPVPAWILWYFLCSMAFGQIIRKALNIDISPT